MVKRYRKAISPVVATVLLVAIAVALSLTVYSVQQGWLADQLAGLSKTTSTIVIEEGWYNATAGNEFIVYVRNAGTETVNISRAYIGHPDGEIELIAVNPEIPVAPDAVATVSLVSQKTIQAGAVYKIQVVADDGASASIIVRT